MAAAVLSLVLAFIVGGGLWVFLGSRLPLADEDDRNQVLNLITYVALSLVPAFVVVFFVLSIA